MYCFHDFEYLTSTINKSSQALQMALKELRTLFHTDIGHNTGQQCESVIETIAEIKKTTNFCCVLLEIRIHSPPKYENDHNICAIFISNLIIIQ